ncbi:histidine kinase [Caproicibacter sp.]|uniref:histidine kinase n=1 Tax=Caproicibacter sp. TaxID=2814884 RepID=UPI003989E8D6
MKKLLCTVGIAFLVFLLTAVCLDWMSLAANSKPSAKVGFSYLEDPAGEMQIGEMDSPSIQKKYTEVQKPYFFFGRTHSAFWIQMNEKTSGAFQDGIAAYCPNLQYAVLYVPTENGYRALYSGWGNSRIRNDAGMTYPVFPLEENRVKGKPVYLRVQSCYANNFTLDFYTQSEFNHAKAIDFCLNSFLFGMLFTVIIVNIVIYFELKSKLCLSFALCVFLISAHQGCSTGIYNVIFPIHSDLPMSLSMQIGALYLISIIVFFLVFSEGTTFGKWDAAILKLLIAACILLIPFSWANPVTTNFFGHFMSIVSPIYIFYLSLRLYRSGQKKQIFFLIGWSLTILLYLLITLNVETILLIPSNRMAHHAALICMVAVSIIFSAALAEHTRKVRAEHMKVRQKYVLATEQVRKTEAALLQTQIKPHFLYNTLTAIESLCEIDSKKAQAAIADFADYLRSNIDFSTETRLITIEREMENVKHYMALEQMRFEGRLRAIYDIQAGGFLLPALAVQPITENAVRYGVTKRPKGGTVKITVKETESAYCIQVSDNGLGFDPAKVQSGDRSHIGIQNAKERVSRLCGGTLTVESHIGVGTNVTILIPKRSIENEHTGS